MIAATTLATVLAGIARYAGGISQILAFVLATVALAGLAWIVSVATEQLGEHLGPAVTGFMHSTVGNLPEFFVVLFALNAGDKTVAETAILGSILVNALLVLGLVLIAGSWRAPGGLMKFSPRLPNDTATLLLTASFIIVLIGLTNSSHDAASHHNRTISIVGAIAILCVYATWARQYLRAGVGEEARPMGGPPPAVRPPTERARRGALPPVALSVTLLVLGGLGSAFVSDWFVHALQPTIHQLHISQAFAGLVIVAIAGNAVENLTGIAMAYRGHADLAIAVVKNSVAQIAAFVYPLLVLVSLLTSTHLTFAIAPVYIGALLGTAVIIWQITGDGEGTIFEGSALVATFVILATVAAFEH
ncbi:MAG: sodium:proton exchanger [Solirubrobacteraceae bacterium]